jgi:hypothetical protein
MISTALKQVLPEFRKDDLNQVLLALTGEVKSGHKEDVVEAVLDAAPPEKVERTLMRFECLSAFKHTWLFTLDTGIPKAHTSDDVKIWAQKLYPDLFKPISTLNHTTKELQPTLQIYDETKSWIYLHCTQWVKTSKWVMQNSVTKTLEIQQLRHPVVIVIKGDLGIGEVRFNGFSQGRDVALEERIPYINIAIQAGELVRQMLGISVIGFPPNTATKALLTELPNELRQLARTAQSAQGSLTVKSNETESGTDIVDLMRAFLGSKLPRETIEEALRDAPSDSIYLEWLKHGIVTRISAEMGHTEILFVWRGERSTLIVNDIVERIAKAYSATKKSTDRGSVRKYIEEQAPGTVFLLSQLIHYFNENPDWIMPIVEAAREDGLVERCYRVRSNSLLQGYRNEWLESPTNLPIVVEDENGQEINLRDPQNIEVGYRRRRDAVAALQHE